MINKTQAWLVIGPLEVGATLMFLPTFLKKQIENSGVYLIIFDNKIW